jgi:UDP-N-acetylmuramoylalanine--D-glutamate ligase
MKKSAVIGLGLTGTSAIHYLQGQGEYVIALDTREAPQGVDALQQQYPDMPIHLGSLQPLLSEPVDRIVLSPGVSLQEPVLKQATQQGIPILSDIDLFLGSNTVPVIGITGSNGKTTVTTWVGECLQALGYSVNVCGNIGIPVLSTVTNKAVDFAVMELSSFQLDASSDLGLDVAVCLNVSPDHLDRHGTLDNYRAAKIRIFKGAKTVVVNAGEDAGYTYNAEPNQRLMAFVRDEKKTKHVAANVAATLAILEAVGIEQKEGLRVIAQCKGLPHRFQTVATIAGVNYINDSKATNVGAAVAAMQSGAQQHKNVVLIAGGQTKAAPLDEWAKAVQQTCSSVILLGEDASLMQSVLSSVGVDSTVVDSLQAAVQLARELVQSGDCVLLAPAAASFDMFSGYEERGRLFEKAVCS